MNELRLKKYALQTCWDGAQFIPTDQAQMARELLALQWTPITAENLPKVGDEVFLRYEDGTSEVFAVESPHTTEWCEFQGYTHRRPLNPPEAEQG